VTTWHIAEVVAGVIVVLLLIAFFQDLRIAPNNLVQDITTKHLYLDEGRPRFSYNPFFEGSNYARQRKYVGVWRISKLPIYMKAFNGNGKTREFIDFPSNFVPISHKDALSAPRD
jgi:hypothetical protein